MISVLIQISTFFESDAAYPVFAVLCSLIHSVLPSLLGWDLWRDFVHLGTDAEKQRLEQGQERGGFSDPPPF